MTAGDWITLGVLALIVGAFFLARKRGRAAAAAAHAAAYAAGFAAGGEAAASAAAVALSAGNVVNISGGGGPPADPGYLVELVAAVLDRLGHVQPMLGQRGVTDDFRVGGMLDGGGLVPAAGDSDPVRCSPYPRGRVAPGLSAGGAAVKE